MTAFANKFRLVLKALSLSRGAVAAEINVDKSLVGRWASGAVTPGDHNLARLTAFVVRRLPQFTLADWDRDLASFARLLGLENSASVAIEGYVAELNLLPPIFVEQARRNTEMRGSAYEGFWRTTRPSVIMDRSFFHDHGMIRMDGNGRLFVRVASAGLISEGWILPAEGNLFAVLYNASGATPMFLIFRGISLPKADALEGLLLFSALNAERTPAAVPILLERIGDLSGETEVDDARCVEVMNMSGSVDAASLSEVVRSYLVRDFGPHSADTGGERFLMVTRGAQLTKGTSPTGQLRG